MIEGGRFSSQQLDVLHREVGPETEIEYRLAWSRTYLKGIGALTNSRRGVWSLTEAGRFLTEEQVASAQQDRERGGSSGGTGTEAGDSRTYGDDELPDAWKPGMLRLLLSMDPTAFERLARRLLREAGFINVTVTRRSGDGGIDGAGSYYPLEQPFVGFSVVFQCKRWQGSVGASVVRDLRGAMAGRGDKGILITTGSATREAKEEAKREGVPPIEIIDGDRLCDLLKNFGLGVKVELVERVTLEPAFFEEI